MSTPDRALILDVDGVVSPVHGHTAWGDDEVAGRVFGPVVVSPAMCRRLDELARDPGIESAWLTSWSHEMRRAIKPLPGADWPEVARVGGLDDDEVSWWKWHALRAWLNPRPQLTRLAWCDDHLTEDHLADLEFTTRPPAAANHTAHDRAPVLYGPSAIRAHLAARGITSLLIAPQTDQGLTPQDLTRLAGFLASSDWIVR